MEQRKKGVREKREERSKDRQKRPVTHHPQSQTLKNSQQSGEKRKTVDGRKD